jgi:hypothetical protein
MSTEPTHTQIVVQFGERIWKRDWPEQMAVFCDVNIRTLTRIQAAERAGQEYPAARGVIAALRDALATAQADLEPWVRRADEG